MTQTQDARCQVPPKGWWCSREPGHEGPCAVRIDPEIDRAGGLWYQRWWNAMERVSALEAELAHLRSTSPAREVGEMIEVMRDGLAAIVRSLRATDQLKANGFASDAADIALGLLHDTLPRLAGSDTEAMRLLQNLSAWLAWVDHDLDEVCADGGITAAMVVQQEARGYRARIDAALAKGGAA